MIIIAFCLLLSLTSCLYVEEQTLAPSVVVIATPTERAVMVEPTPTPLAIDPETLALMREIEAEMPGVTFEFAPQDKLEAVLTAMGGEFYGIGRLADGVGEYYLLRPLKPLPQGFRFSTYEVWAEEATYYIESIDVVTGEVESEYTVPKGYMVAAESGDIVQLWTEETSEKLFFAMRQYWRSLAAYARTLGVSSGYDTQADFSFSFSFYGEACYAATGFSSPVEYPIYLTPDEAQTVREAWEQRELLGELPFDGLFSTGVYLVFPDDYFKGSENPLEYDHVYLLSDGTFVTPDGRARLSLIDELLQEKHKEKIGSDLLADPLEEVTSLRSASIALFGNGEEAERAVVNDAESLATLLELLDKREPEIGGSKCPFTGFLTLETAAGDTLSVALATDSCTTVWIDGRIPMHKVDVDAVLALFGLSR